MFEICKKCNFYNLYGLEVEKSFVNLFIIVLKFNPKETLTDHESLECKINNHYNDF